VSIIVGIVDYQAGNIRSLSNAFESLGVEVSLVTNSLDILSKTHLVLPGVGAFGHCAEKLVKSGLITSLHDWVFSGERPLLGICVGMQLLGDFSEEFGRHNGLGWIGGEIRRLNPKDSQVRIPHVGWNTVEFKEDFGSFRTGDCADFYFDHSYAYTNPRDGRIVGSCSHGTSFSAIIRQGNLIATQFHPEKSQEAGKRFLAGYLKMA